MGDSILKTVREDDFIEYFVFPQVTSKDNKEEELSLNRLVAESGNFLKKYTASYLWHKDPFKLVPKTAINSFLNNVDNDLENLPPHLYGLTHCGDNIDDEWFIVYMLLELTKEIQGLVVRVVDVDGEFLLIEAADYLPMWATPETCDKRVYLYNGFVHIVAPEDSLSLETVSDAVSIRDAVSEIRKNPALTVASPEIQNAIKNKIKDYPSAIKENLHRTTAYLPVGVAALLNHKPQLIAPAVQAFCNRDTVDLKACRAMKYFPPEIRVKASVTFTKHLYAMLVHSKYLPDRTTGWKVPPVNNPEYKSHLLGVKIACGFEILVSQAKPSSSVDCDRGWNVYLEKLKSTNYFRELLEHSKEYNELFNKAKEYYVNNRDSMQYSPPVGEELLKLTKSLDYNVDDLKKVEGSLPKDDDESWLDITPEQLDKMLQEKYGQKRMFNFNNNSDAVNFTQKVTEFLEHISDIDGAEFPSPSSEPSEESPMEGSKGSLGSIGNGNEMGMGNAMGNGNSMGNGNAMENGETRNGVAMVNGEEDSPIRPPRGVKAKGKSKVSFAEDTKIEEKPNKVNFDANSFSCAVQNILNFVIPEDDSWNLESDSDMSDYGKEDENDASYIGLKAKMEEYMSQMDKELAGTTIGESFATANGNDPLADNPLADNPFASNNPFAANNPFSSSNTSDKFDDIESFKPVDIDMNALKNILESYRSQLGEAGPSSNMLGPMGIHLDGEGKTDENA